MRKKILSLLALLLMTAAGAVAQSYTVTVKEGTADADKWSISPSSAAAGAKVTATYSGSKEVKSVKAVKKVEEVEERDPIDLSEGLEEDLELQNGDIIYGTLNTSSYYYEGKKIVIADGATVTLNGATINGVDNVSYIFAGLTCLGDATIILADGSENTVKGFYTDYPGIFVPENKTLTIKGGSAGTGTLTASSYGVSGIGSSSGVNCGNIVIEGGIITAKSDGDAPGIGGGNGGSCGTITINGGTVTATGGGDSPGIGSGYQASCGAISISGGTVTATGGKDAAGIGTGYIASCGAITISGGTVVAQGDGYGAGIGKGDSGSCDSVTITAGVTSVTATKGEDAFNSIDATKVTIGGTETGSISESPYTYNPNL